MNEALGWLLALSSSQETLLVWGLGAVFIAIFLVVVVKIDSVRTKKLAAELQMHEAEFQRRKIEFESALKGGEVDEMIREAAGLVDSAWRANNDALGVAQKIYNEALALVEKDSKFRRYALETGRLSLGVTRPDGKPTIYDEKAIQNDIEVRLS